MAGEFFLVVAAMNFEIAQTYIYDRVTWLWSTASWTLESFFRGKLLATSVPTMNITCCST